MKILSAILSDYNYFDYIYNYNNSVKALIKGIILNHVFKSVSTITS